MRIILIRVVVISLLASCAPMKLQVPERFAEQATRLHVKGLKSRNLSFENYTSSNVKRGWNPGRSKDDITASAPQEEDVEKRLALNKPGMRDKTGNKFHFTLNDGKISTVVFFKEAAIRKQEGQGLRGPREMSLSRPSDHQYNLSAIIRELETTDTSIWKMMMHTWYDHMHDSVSGMFELPFTDEERYLTNGKETFAIRAIRVKSVVSGNKSGEFPIKMLSGFEFRIDDGVVAIVDIKSDDIWIYKELDDKTKLIIASAASVILLRKANVE